MVNLTAAERVYEYWIDKASSTADLVLKIVFAVILFLVARKLILWLCGLIRKNMRRFNTEEAVVSFTVSMVKYSLNTLLVLTIIVQLGIVSEASIAAAIASAGVAVSLALQGGLSNFAGGVMILLLKPFKVGDYIIFPGEGQEGTVKKIEMYYTTINSIDNRTIMIPNANLTNHTIINVTAMDRRKLEIKVGFAVSFQSGYNAFLHCAEYASCVACKLAYCVNGLCRGLFLRLLFCLCFSRCRSCCFLSHALPP